MLRSTIVVFATLIPVFTAQGQFGEVRPRREGNPVSDHVLLIGANQLQSTLINIAAQQLLIRTPNWGDAPPATVQVEMLLGHEIAGATVVALTVWIPPSAPVESDAQRRDVWDRARRELESEIERISSLAFKAQSTRLEIQLNRMVSQRQELQQRGAAIAQQVAQLEAKTGGSDRESIAKAIGEALSNQRGLQLEAAGIEARREAIEKRIDELREIAAAQGDPIVDELEHILRIREQELVHKKLANEKTRGAVPEAQLLAAEGRIVEARIELLRAQREAADRLSGGALRELNNDLSKLLVEAAKVRGQQKELERIVAELREQVVSTAEAEAALSPLRAEVQAIARQRGELENQITLLRQQLASMSEPTIELKPLIENPTDGEPEASVSGTTPDDEASTEKD